jgi:hypothetical protein
MIHSIFVTQKSKHPQMTCLQQVPIPKLNSVAWVRERTIPTKRPPLVVEVSADFRGYRVPRSQCDRSLRSYSRFSRPEPLLFLPNSSSIVLTRLSGPRFRPTTSRKIFWPWDRIRCIWICSQELLLVGHRSGRIERDKVIPVTERRGLRRCEMFSIPQCLDNRLTYGGDVVSLTHQLRPSLQKFLSAPGTHFW